MKLIYGTKNKAKVNHMKKISNYLNIDIEGVDLGVEDISEKGTSIEENARIKALHFYSKIKQPVFSCDSGLYFDHLDDEKQTGIFIRRVNSKRLTDEEMIDYYSNIAKENGGQAIARYKNAICLVMNENEIYEYSGLDLASTSFKIVEKPHEKRREGFPLDSLSVEIKSNKYYFDIKEFVAEGDMQNGFVDFFKRVLGDAYK